MKLVGTAGVFIFWQFHIPSQLISVVSIHVACTRSGELTTTCKFPLLGNFMVIKT